MCWAIFFTDSSGHPVRNAPFYGVATLQNTTPKLFMYYDFIPKITSDWFSRFGSTYVISSNCMFNKRNTNVLIINICAMLLA
jgi:hypothetical protein